MRSMMVNMRLKPFSDDKILKSSSVVGLKTQLRERKDTRCDNEYVGEPEWSAKPHPRRSSGGIIFEATDCPPYFHPLDGRTYRASSAFGPSGMCPLCNNERHREIDHELIVKLGRIPETGYMGLTHRQVVTHIVNHVGPVYVVAGEDATDGPHEAVRPQKRSRVHGPQAVIDRALLVEAGERIGKYDNDVALLTPDDIAWYDAAFERAADRPPPSQEPQGRPQGSQPKKWYAFDGEEQLGPLRPWGDDRVETEVQKRNEDAIVFYDEMLDARRMARRIYADIMDSDIDALNDSREESGGKYVERNYSAAIAAVREIRSIATDMAKLALIATKYSDGKEKTRVLSPVMQGLIDDIGVFEAEDASCSFGEADPVDDDGVDYAAEDD